MAKKKIDTKLVALLDDWKAFSKFLMLNTTTEDDCRLLLETEKARTKPRASVLTRVHMRFDRLRKERERAELKALARQ